MAERNPAATVNFSSKALEGVSQFYKECRGMYQSQWSLRSMFERIDLDYMREGDLSADDYESKMANLRGDKSKMRNPVVPVIYPQVEAATAYMTGTFLTGYPIFGVAANPSLVNQALQMETIIAAEQIYGGWIREFMLFFRDGFKYNLHALEVDWCREVAYELQNDASYMNGNEAKPVRSVWEGNKIKRLDMYNTWWDTRVNPADVSKKGEFAGYDELMSRVRLKQFLNDLPDEGKLLQNFQPAFESGMGGAPYENYYVPRLNPDATIETDPRASTNWLAWAGIEADKQGIRYQNMYCLSTLAARLIPADFGLNVPFKNHPQIWKFYIVNNQWPVYAERLTNAHNRLPIVIGQPLEDGLGYQTKSFSQNVKPYQDIATALWAAKMHSERRRVMDRIFYDPNRIRASDINVANPVARIPVKSSAYNKNINEAVYPMPFQDQNSQFFVQTAQMVFEMAQMTNGMNRPIEGQFQKGNKTQYEFQTIMGNANARLQSNALFIETQTMSPIKEMIKTNILQYQGPDKIYNIDQQLEVEIDPVKLRQSSLEFKMSDGILPTEKILSADFMGMFLQVMGSSPELNMEFKTMDMFTYWAKIKGFRDLEQFRRSAEEKAMYVQQVQAMSAPPAGTPAEGTPTV